MRWDDVVVDNSKVNPDIRLGGNKGNKSKSVSAFLARNFATRYKKC